MKPTSPKRSAADRGVALLLVLGALAVVAAGLAVLGRQASAARIGVAADEGCLQRRWLWRSAEDALRSAPLFADAPAGASGTAPPDASFDWDFDLGHHRGRLRFADESTKADLNTLLPAGDADALRRAKLLAAELGVTTPLEPRAYAGLDAPWRRYTLPEQLVEPRFVPELRELTPRGVAGPLDVFTLWGGATLRASRAPQAVTRAVLADAFTDIEARRLAAHFAIPATRRPRLDAELVERLNGRIAEAPGPASVRGFMDDGRRRYGGLRVLSGGSSTLRFNW